MRPDVDDGNGDWNWLRDRVTRDENLVLISGYARLPEKVSSYAQWEQLGVILVIDTSNDVIVAADATLVTDAARAFFRGVVEGRSIRTEVSAIINRLDTQYHGHTGPALVTAFRRCLEHVGIHVVERESNPRGGGNQV